VAEQPVFWLGGKPGKSNEPKAPEAEAYADALTETCEACGYHVDEYVAAMGSFGGWLAHLKRDGQQYRLFWNGKQQELAFEKSQPQGGWEVLETAATADAGTAGFVIAVRELLGKHAES
jgi:hypothetical protein